MIDVLGIGAIRILIHTSVKLVTQYAQWLAMAERILIHTSVKLVTEEFGNTFHLDAILIHTSVKLVTQHAIRGNGKARF